MIVYYSMLALFVHKAGYCEFIIFTFVHVFFYKANLLFLSSIFVIYTDICTNFAEDADELRIK